eukprot:GEMP01060125.1.p1 GENE.GEMP01060125.1~~GEMP01060125.1.p1  ORF type:complete len:147 (+),score=13.61 GEMP01060125.1:22-441(+)
MVLPALPLVPAIWGLACAGATGTTAYCTKLYSDMAKELAAVSAEVSSLNNGVTIGSVGRKVFPIESILKPLAQAIKPHASSLVNYYGASLVISTILVVTLVWELRLLRRTQNQLMDCVIELLREREHREAEEALKRRAL